jgi:FkbM family methyltransferase
MRQLSTLEEHLDSLLAVDPALVRDRERTAFDALTHPFEKSLVLYGAGNLGRKTLQGLRSVGIEPLAFADGNPASHGTMVDRLKVLPPEEAVKRFGHSAAFVVTVWSPGLDRLFVNIRRQLTDLGCSKVVSFMPLFWKWPELFLPHSVVDLPHKLVTDQAPIREAFALWDDDRSRQQYLIQLEWFLSGVPTPRCPLTADALALEITGGFDVDGGPQYFPHDLLVPAEKEVFVDCGAYDGDTLRAFLDWSGSRFERYFALEPDPITLPRLTHYVGTLPQNIRKKIETRACAAGSSQRTALFDARGAPNSNLAVAGTVPVDCVTLDNAFANQTPPPTFIKMDIEGAEVDALTGAPHIIAKNLPVLAICLYHEREHLWRIPLLIRALAQERAGDYRFFCRRYLNAFMELVCYAIPLSRLAPGLDSLDNSLNNVTYSR